MSATWEGRILSIGGGEFIAELVGEDGMTLTADFAVSSLPSDEPLNPGDVFIAPEMRLLRLGPWTADEVAEVYSRADVLLARLATLSD